MASYTTRGAFVHAAIAGASGLVYEMTTSGFNAPSVQSFYAKYDYVVVLRIAALQDARKQAKIIRLADNMRTMICHIHYVTQ